MPVCVDTRARYLARLLLVEDDRVPGGRPMQESQYTFRVPVAEARMRAVVSSPRPHPRKPISRRPGDARFCSGVGKIVRDTKYGGLLDDPGEDPPTVDPRGVRR